MNKRIISSLGLGVAAFLASLTPLSSVTGSARGEELNEIFKRVNEYVANKNYTKARDELNWAIKEVEKLNTTRLKDFFADKVGDYTGRKLEVNSVLGMDSVERSYQVPAGKGAITVTLSGSGGGHGAAAGMGGLAAFGRMAAMMGSGQEGQDTFRMNGRTASSEKKENAIDLTIFLDSGGILKFEQTGSDDLELVKKFVSKFDVDGLDKYLKG